MGGFKILQGQGCPQVHESDDCVLFFPNIDLNPNIVFIVLEPLGPGSDASYLRVLSLLRLKWGAQHRGEEYYHNTPIVAMVVVFVVFILPFPEVNIIYRLWEAER